jgi:hypothetical protein
MTDDDEPKQFYGAECPSYPNCTGGCGLGCTREIEAARDANCAVKRRMTKYERRLDP